MFCYLNITAMMRGNLLPDKTPISLDSSLVVHTAIPALMKQRQADLL